MNMTAQKKHYSIKCYLREKVYPCRKFKINEK